jgi:hypothetical protein
MRLPVGQQDIQWFDKDGKPTTYAYERLQALLGGLPDLQTVTAGFTLSKGYAGVLIVVNAAAGATFILPKSDGGNARYRFLLGTTITSNSTIIKVGNSIDAFIGQSMMVSDDPATVKGFIASPGSDDTITFNGSTKGGFAGDYVEILDIAAGTFFVRITGKQTGTEATMFSATV